MAKHARSQIGSEQPMSRRQMMLWAVSGCSVIVLLQAAWEVWEGHQQIAVLGLFLASALALLCASIFRRDRTVPFEILTVIAACAWIAAGVSQHGIGALVWAYACIAAVALLSPARYGEAFAACVVVCTGTVLWCTQQSGVTVGAMALMLVFTAFMKLYKVSMNSQRDAENAARIQVELLLRCSDAGCLEWNGTDRAARYSPRLCEMLGRPPDFDALQTDFWSHLPIGFRSRVKTAFFKQIEGVTAPYETVQLQSMEYPLIREDRTQIWVHARAIRISDGAGRLARYVCTFVDITARSEIERQLRVVNAGAEAQVREITRQHTVLEKALHAREHVERLACHDLRAPLGQIASITGALRSVHRSASEEDALLSTLETTARRAMRMVKLAVDFYPLEEGRFEFVPEPVDMVELVQRVCDTLELQAASKRLSFVRYPESDELWAQADVVLCETILENLLKNAIEAAPEGSRITVRISDGSKVRVSIHNEGSVPLKVRENFFHKYSTADKVGGTGLGTYSAQLMARAQFGNVRMSTSEEKGTVLVLELTPVIDPLAVPGSEMPSPEVTAEKEILIVDDDAYSVLSMTGLVQAHGTVRTAVNGRAAIDAITTQRPDFIFIDLEMPVMGGMEAVGLIRKYQEATGQEASKIIAMSAHDDAGTRRRCKAAGFDRCVDKPVSKKCIVEVLGRVDTCANSPTRLLACSDFSMVSLQA